ncbi:MAG TPA: helix-turn-helix transcriptional regulator [Desulfitobacterium dehalogenans]|uniref:Helix-turn-helix transcriptional regulator n=1 Tax=Desulfitobacterium dehalogenans TaxID=36854 RepID=A0A7C6Z3S9_9FIRM|nr:helix-turn-helix transcriptional regulator [Desulfitobacterium dehalogenans]
MYVLDHVRPVQFTPKGLRELHGLSLSEASREIGIDSKTLKKYELDPGRMRVSAIFKIARFYGVSVDCIYFGADQECAAANKQRLNFKKKNGDEL